MFLSYIKNRTSSVFFLLASAVLCCSLCANTMTVHATYEELTQEAEERKALPIQSNDIENWPAGPAVSAESAILMDIDTGSILYAKNIHKKSYPASTTKLLTCLIAVEQGNLDDMVSFSDTAIFSVPTDGSKIGMDVGESITLEQSLYGILVGSANEVANAVGEYISGSLEEFINLMNERAAQLGCTDSHFMNTNGLHDDNHYTSAYDLALISAAFFQNDMLCKIGNTDRYEFTATATQPDDFILKNKHRLITGEDPYDGILGGKTGYTDQARQTLVTCAEQNGMRLVCVVFKEESPSQFTDTIELFDYGFHNFQLMNISEHEDKYQIEPSGFLQTGNDIFGSSKPILTIDNNSSVIIPNTVSFDDLDSTIDYNVSDENRIAQIEYSYNDTYVGSAYLELAADNASNYEFDTNLETTNISVEKSDEESAGPDQNNIIFINVKKVLIIVLSTAFIMIVLFILRAFTINNRNARRRQNRVKRKQHRRERIRSDFDDFEDLVGRLEKAATEEVLDMFDSRDSFLWFGLFARFIKLGLADRKFIQFMTEFSQSLHGRKVDGKCYDELNRKATKDKNVVIRKMEKLVADMFVMLAGRYEKYGYKYFYEPDEEEITEACEANGWEFLEDGTFYAA